MCDIQNSLLNKILKQNISNNNDDAIFIPVDQDLVQLAY